MAEVHPTLFGPSEPYKRCSTCKETKALTEFNRSPGKKYGRDHECALCRRKRRRRPKDPEMVQYRIEPLQLPATLNAYLAGLIDGEAYMGITKNPKGRGGLIKISMTDDVLRDVRDEVGLGPIYLTKKRDPRHRDQWTWLLFGNNVRRLLPGVLPYLRFKKRQAELLLRFLDLANHRVSHDTKDIEVYNREAEELYREVKRLNQRGRKAIDVPGERRNFLLYKVIR